MAENYNLRHSDNLTGHCCEVPDAFVVHGGGDADALHPAHVGLLPSDQHVIPHDVAFSKVKLSASPADPEPARLGAAQDVGGAGSCLVLSRHRGSHRAQLVVVSTDDDLVRRDAGDAQILRQSHVGLGAGFYLEHHGRVSGGGVPGVLVFIISRCVEHGVSH